jgi:TolB-like protein/Tfp pilus assembly protein PilF
MTEHPRAVFLSYASEDAVAAEKICGALRAAGIEVWFDRSELRGGDAWDAAIRRQIKNCALFLPIISVNTHARAEGYFRLEWKLAIDRSHLIAADRPFLVPVAVDATPQSDERVPDRFRELQWTRLPGGETPPAFVERVTRLLSPGAPPLPARQRLADAAAAAAPARAAPRFAVPWWGWLMAAIVVASYFALRPPPRPARSGDAGVAAARPAGIPEKSIAVLPFVDMSEKKDQEYFSDGLAEELLDLLSQVPDLHVPARTSSFYFKGRSDDVATIAQKLKVAHVLEGSVRRSGNAIRVTAQLIRADNGYHLWSKTYDRDVKDVFQVQDDIANAVVDALKAQLLSERPLVTRDRTDNPQAFNEYLMGNSLRERDTSGANRQALESYQRAVALDPKYAAAYSGIADAEWRIADQETGEAAGYARSLAAAEHAIALAPNSPDGYWARGGLRQAYYYDWPGAEADFRKALALDPNDERTLRDYATLLASRGAPREAEDMMRRALTLDPLAVRTWRGLGELLIDVGRTPEARPIVQRIRDITPNSWSGYALAGRIALVEGRFNDALAQFSQASPAYALIGTAMAQHSLGRRSESQAALEELIKRFGTTLGYQIAEVYAWRGEHDKAIEWLQGAYQRHDGGLIYLSYDSYFAAMRADARFQALLKKLNVPS